jgi:hypothetical protein
MGSCLSKDNTVTPRNKPPPISSSRKNLRKNKDNLIGIQDFLGVKKSDSIDNFYNIDCVIGRGAFGEVVLAPVLGNLALSIREYLREKK